MTFQPFQSMPPLLAPNHQHQAIAIAVFIGNETCVICHPIFLQFILKAAINFSLRVREKRRRRALKKRYFVSSLSIWYKVLSPKINITPFPNKFKTLFHSQMFLTRLFLSVSRVNQKLLFVTKSSGHKKTRLCYQQRRRPIACVCLILISINAESRLK